MVGDGANIDGNFLRCCRDNCKPVAGFKSKKGLWAYIFSGCGNAFITMLAEGVDLLVEFGDRFFRLANGSTR